MEKRRFPRFAVKLPVTLRHKGKLIPATATNISCGGMFIAAESIDISEEHPVEVIFDLDENRDLSMRGLVTRIDSDKETSGLGVQFTSFFSDSHKVVQNYINSNLN
jgi:PilZ domain